MSAAPVVILSAVPVVILSAVPVVILSAVPVVILSAAKDLLLSGKQQILRRFAPQDDMGELRSSGRHARAPLLRLTLARKRSHGQIVMSVMRSTRALVLSALAAASACARPVLYYPVPAGAPSQPTAQPTLAGTAANVTAATVSTAGLADLDYLRARRIMLPVAGADMSKVEDTFNDPRDGGDRVHRAIDILAPRGTPILSADDGKILRMTTSTLGGITMYTVDPQARLVYYYAHMDHYNDTMSPGRTIVKGDTLGYVGTTGNAPKDTPHLHFQVMRWPADGKYWNGDPIDPFEALGGIPRGDRAKHNAGQPFEY